MENTRLYEFRWTYQKLLNFYRMWPFNKKRQNKKIHDSIISTIKSEQCSFEGIFSSISHRKEIENLYKSLCKKCHPDKFAHNEKLKEIASNLFVEIQEARNNYDKLLLLKDIIEKKLLTNEMR